MLNADISLAEADLVAEARRLLRRGWSQKKIARYYRINIHTLRRMLRRVHG